MPPPSRGWYNCTTDRAPNSAVRPRSGWGTLLVRGRMGGIFPRYHAHERGENILKGGEKEGTCPQRLHGVLSYLPPKKTIFLPFHPPLFWGGSTTTFCVPYNRLLLPRHLSRRRNPQRISPFHPSLSTPPPFSYPSHPPSSSLFLLSPIPSLIV